VKRTHLWTAVVAAALVTGGCEGRAPTAPDSMPAVSGSVSALSTTHGGGATTELVEFAFNPTINVPAPCLGGGLFVITGTVQGGRASPRRRMGRCSRMASSSSLEWRRKSRRSRASARIREEFTGFCRGGCWPGRRMAFLPIK
jgi:hypothetical protein